MGKPDLQVVVTGNREVVNTYEVRTPSGVAVAKYDANVQGGYAEAKQAAIDCLKRHRERDPKSTLKAYCVVTTTDVQEIG